MSKKDKTPYEVLKDACANDEIVFTVRTKRSRINVNDAGIVYFVGELITSAEVIRLLQVGDRIAHRGRVNGNNRTRLIRATTEIDGVLFVGFRGFNTLEDVFDPLGIEDNTLTFAPAREYERVEE